jgi:hypothetical protein
MISILYEKPYVAIGDPSIVSFLNTCVSLQIPHHRGLSIEARLGDLDLKTSSGHKAEYWRSVEKQLIDGRWYMGTERDGEGQGRNRCQLGYD